MYANATMPEKLLPKFNEEIVCFLTQFFVAQRPILKTTSTLSRLKRKRYKPMVAYINKMHTSIW
jgi:hypothetical protein